mmetsp:Transcript_100445/g.283308  ORF Transcript_100445/g.283308 Transcript_100445/m.283308 type:complete len:325 (+) Transcript_100445:185-1159(+)
MEFPQAEAANLRAGADAPLTAQVSGKGTMVCESVEASACIIPVAPPPGVGQRPGVKSRIVKSHATQEQAHDTTPPGDALSALAGKIVGVSGELEELRDNIDLRRNTRFMQMRGNLKFLDDRLSAWHNEGSKRFELVRSGFKTFQEEFGAETQQRGELGKRMGQDISELDQSMLSAMQAEQASLRNQKSQILQLFESKLDALREDTTRTDRVGNDNEAKLRRHLEEDVPELYDMLRDERKNREQMEKHMLTTALAEVEELQGTIAAEKQAREDAEEVMLRMLEDAVEKMQAEIANERRERQQTEQMLVTLLKQAVGSLELTSKSL